MVKLLFNNKKNTKKKLSPSATTAEGRREKHPMYQYALNEYAQTVPAGSSNDTGKDLMSLQVSSSSSSSFGAAGVGGSVILPPAIETSSSWGTINSVITNGASGTVGPGDGGTNSNAGSAISYHQQYSASTSNLAAQPHQPLHGGMATSMSSPSQVIGLGISSRSSRSTVENSSDTQTKSNNNILQAASSDDSVKAHPAMSPQYHHLQQQQQQQHRAGNVRNDSSILPQTSTSHDRTSSSNNSKNTNATITTSVSERTPGSTVSNAMTGGGQDPMMMMNQHPTITTTPVPSSINQPAGGSSLLMNAGSSVHPHIRAPYLNNHPSYYPHPAILSRSPFEADMPDATYEEYYGDAYTGGPIKYVYPSGYQSMRPRSGPWKLSIVICLLFTWLSVFIVGHCSDQVDANQYRNEEIDDDALAIDIRWCGSRPLYLMWVASMLITGLSAAYCSVIGYIKVRDFAVGNARSQPPGVVFCKSDYYVQIHDNNGTQTQNSNVPYGGSNPATAAPRSDADGSGASSGGYYRTTIYQSDGTPQFWGPYIYRPTQAAVAITSR